MILTLFIISILLLMIIDTYFDRTEGTSFGNKIRDNKYDSDGNLCETEFTKIEKSKFSILVVSLVLSLALLVTSFLVGLTCTATLIKYKIETLEIDVYVEENDKIENKLDYLVDQYIEHEDDIVRYSLPQKTSEDLMYAISLFPELKSDTLVSKQMDIYIQNSEKIKDLKIKEKKIKYYKWLLFFIS